MNPSKTEQRISPLYCVLPRRLSEGGSRPGVTASVDKDDHRVFPEVELTTLEKRIIIATMMQIGVLVMFNTHVYSFNGEMFLQKAGGPIGLRSICAVARITMNEWDARWMEVMKKNNIRIRSGDRYMDDLRCFMNSLKAGWRWHEGYFCYTYGWRQEDLMAGK